MIILSNGAKYTLDRATQTIEYIGGGKPNRRNEKVATIASTLLQSGELVGPQCDQFAGVHGDWNEPLGPLAAMIQAACRKGLSVRSAG